MKVTLLNMTVNESRNTASSAYQKLINNKESNDNEELNDEELNDDEESDYNEELDDDEESDDEEMSDDEELNDNKELNNDNEDLYNISDKEEEQQKCHNIEQMLSDSQDSPQQSNLHYSKHQIEEDLKGWSPEALFSLLETLTSG